MKDNKQEEKKGLYSESKGGLQDSSSGALSPKISPEEEGKFALKRLSSTFAPQYLDNRVKRIQRFWKEQISKDTHIPVLESKNQSPDFIKFRNKQPLQKSLNLAKKKALLKAIHEGDWKANIFEDTDLEYLTVSLFSAGKITAQQNTTILEKKQVIAEKKAIEIYPLLDENFQLTLEAYKFLLPGLTQYFPGKLNVLQIEKIREKILELPPSERFFYLSDGSKYKNLMNDKELKKLNLDERLISLNVIPLITHPSFKLIHLSDGFRQAYGDVVFGPRNHVRKVPMLGKKKVSDIERGVRDHERYSEINCQENKTEMDIHNYKNVPPTIAISHDFYHLILMSVLGFEFCQGFLNFVDAIREVIKEDLENKKTGEIWSKEIWDLIDGEFIFIYTLYRYLNLNLEKWRNNDYDSKEITRLFMYTLMYKGKYYRNLILPKKDRSPEELKTLQDPNRNITFIGIILLLNFLAKPEKWTKNKINFEWLASNHPMRPFYDEIKNYYPLIKSRPQKIQIVLILLWRHLQTIKSRITFQDLLKIIDVDQAYFLGRIKFTKATKNDDINRKNSLILSYDKIPFKVDPNQNRNIFESLNNHYIMKKYNNNENIRTNFTDALTRLKYDFETAEVYAVGKEVIAGHHQYIFNNGLNFDLKLLKYILKNHPDKNQTLKLKDQFFEIYNEHLSEAQKKELLSIIKFQNLPVEHWIEIVGSSLNYCRLKLQSQTSLFSFFNRDFKQFEGEVDNFIKKLHIIKDQEGVSAVLVHINNFLEQKTTGSNQDQFKEFKGILVKMLNSFVLIHADFEVINNGKIDLSKLIEMLPSNPSLSQSPKLGNF